jgi:hypothetical protein
MISTLKTSGLSSLVLLFLLLLTLCAAFPTQPFATGNNNTFGKRQCQRDPEEPTRFDCDFEPPTLEELIERFQIDRYGKADADHAVAFVGRTT